jgi:hypothetical protein
MHVCLSNGHKCRSKEQRASRHTLGFQASMPLKCSTNSSDVPNILVPFPSAALFQTMRVYFVLTCIYCLLTCKASDLVSRLCQHLASMILNHCNFLVSMLIFHRTRSSNKNINNCNKSLGKNTIAKIPHDVLELLASF